LMSTWRQAKQTANSRCIHQPKMSNKGLVN